MLIDLAQIKERKKMDDMMTLRIIAICLATLLPGFYYIFSTSIKRACLFFSITISMYLSFEFLYLSGSLWLSDHRFFAAVDIITGCILIQFCRIHLIKYIFKRGEQFFN